MPLICYDGKRIQETRKMHGKNCNDNLVRSYKNTMFCLTTTLDFNNIQYDSTRLFRTGIETKKFRIYKAI